MNSMFSWPGQSFRDYLASRLAGFEGMPPNMADFEDHLMGWQSPRTVVLFVYIFDGIKKP